GSAFTVTFPGRTELTEPVSISPTEEQYARAVTGLRVVLVEDQPDAREILAAGLHHFGVEVVEAATSREALEAIDSSVAAGRLPDVVVSDIGLPGEDGYRLIEHLSARPPSLGGAI